MDDKRKYPRAPINAIVKICHEDIGEQLFTARDISDGGIFVVDEGRSFPTLGSVVTVQVQGLPIVAPILNMVIVRKGKDGYGLRFL